MRSKSGGVAALAVALVISFAGATAAFASPPPPPASPGGVPGAGLAEEAATSRLAVRGGLSFVGSTGTRSGSYADTFGGGFTGLLSYERQLGHPKLYVGGTFHLATVETDREWDVTSYALSLSFSARWRHVGPFLVVAGAGLGYAYIDHGYFEDGLGAMQLGAFVAGEAALGSQTALIELGTATTMFGGNDSYNTEYSFLYAAAGLVL